MNEQQKFNYHRKTGLLPSEGPKEVKTHGVLLYQGHPVSLPLPYAILQTIKKQMIQDGYIAKDFKIRKHYD